MNNTPNNETKTNIPDYPRIYIPDYTRELKFHNKLLQQFLKSDHQQQIDACVQRIESKIDSMPKIIPVKHHHHFAFGSIAFLSMLGILLISWVAAYFLYSAKQDLKQANDELRRDTLSYFLVKAYHPDVANEIEQRFSAHPKEYTNRAIELLKNKKSNDKNK